MKAAETGSLTHVELKQSLSSPTWELEVGRAAPAPLMVLPASGGKTEKDREEEFFEVTPHVHDVRQQPLLNKTEQVYDLTSFGSLL